MRAACKARFGSHSFVDGSRWALKATRLTDLDLPTLINLFVPKFSPFEKSVYAKSDSLYPC